MRQKAKDQIASDKTFGLKNAKKSKKVQAAIAHVNKQYRGDEMQRCRLVPVLVQRVVRGAQQQARQAHARSGRLLLVRRNRQHGAEERVARLAATRAGQAGAPPCVARPVRWAGGMLAPPPPLGIRARGAWLQLSRLVAATAHA